MTVLHVISDLRTGGAERVVSYLVSGLAGRGEEVFLATLSSRVDARNAEILAQAGVRPIVLASHRNDPLIPLRLSRLVRNLNVSIVHTHLFPAIYYGALVGGVERVLTEHSPTNRRRTTATSGKVERRVYERYGRIVAISDGVADSLLELLGSRAKIERIWNGIPIPPNDTVGVVEPENDEELRLVGVGTLDHRKNYAKAIEAIGHFDTVTLTLVGDGPERSQLESLAAQVAPGRVTFLGTQMDVTSILRRHHAFVSTSVYEGFGIAALEAMSQGLAVIGPTTPGLAEVVGETGILTGPQGEDLVAALARVSDDRNILVELGTRAQERSRGFSIDRMVLNYMDLYRRMTACLES